MRCLVDRRQAATGLLRPWAGHTGSRAKCVEGAWPGNALIDRLARQHRALVCDGHAAGWHWCLREEGDGGGEAVDGVAAADRTELSGTEHPRHRGGAEQVTDNNGVVVGRAEQPPTA